MKGILPPGIKCAAVTRQTDGVPVCFAVCGNKGNEFAAMGDGGNTIYVNRDKNMVVSIAALFTPRAKDRIDLIQKYIVPIFDTDML